MIINHRCNSKLHKFRLSPYNCNGMRNAFVISNYVVHFHESKRRSLKTKLRLCIYRQTHHQHSSHSAAGHHGSSAQSGHIDAKYADNVNGHDTLTDFVTFVCQETDNSPQSSQVSFIRRTHSIQEHTHTQKWKK